MPLLACPDCGKKVSDKAASCPNCGSPIASRSEDLRKQESARELKLSEMKYGGKLPRPPGFAILYVLLTLAYFLVMIIAQNTTIGIICFLQIVFLSRLFYWKRWGYYGFVVLASVEFIFRLASGFSIGYASLSFLVVGLLFWSMRGKVHGRPMWDCLE